ncbi:MAG: invasion associated locus B family protein [Methylocystis sp.]
MMRNDTTNFFRAAIFRGALLALTGAAIACAGAPALARTKAKPDAASAADKKKVGAKPEQLGSYGDWGAYAATGKDKTCYALGSPKERQPKSKVKDTQAFIFISTRPGEGVRNEVAINLGYPTKDGGAAIADVDDDRYDLVTKGVNAWVKNPAKEKDFVEALKTGTKLLVKASSAKGTTTVDSYSLKGLSDALARVAQECK